MGGTLNYNSPKRFKTANESVISLAGEFPKCKGLYPDCPNEPSLMDPMCRTCPKTEGMKKPKIEEDNNESKETKEEPEKNIEEINEIKEVSTEQ